MSDWQTHQGTVMERIKCLLKEGFLSDCKFTVSNAQMRKEFKAHKLILSMASPVFEKMFQNGFSESDNDIIITDVEPEAFEAMLNYVYLDEVNILSFDHACSICYVAEKYMLSKLIKSCTSYILKAMNHSNAVRVYEFATLFDHFDQYDLIENSKKIINTQTSAVLAHPSFTEMQFPTLKMILQQNELNITELQLFKAIESWTNAEFERNGISDNEHLEKQQAIYAELVPQIRFLSMTPKEFAEGPAMSSLLTKDQILGILMNLVSSNCGFPMPNGFSKICRTFKPEPIIEDKQKCQLGNNQFMFGTTNRGSTFSNSVFNVPLHNLPNLSPEHSQEIAGQRTFFFSTPTTPILNN